MVNHNAAAANFCHGRSFRDNPQISIETMTHLIKCDFAANLKSSHGNHLPLVYVLRDGPEMMAYISNLSLWPKIFFYEVEKPDAVSIPKENIVPAGQGQSVQDWLGTFSREDPDTAGIVVVTTLESVRGIPNWAPEGFTDVIVPKQVYGS